MKPDINKIKHASQEELIEQYDLAEKEIQSDSLMNPISYARYLEIEEYKTAIHEELKQDRIEI